MKRSGLARLLVAGAFALPLLGFAPGAALAAEAPQRPAEEPEPAVEIAPMGNYDDTGYYFYMASKGKSAATGYRVKTDASSVYVGITRCYGKPRMYVDGAWTSTGSGYIDATVGQCRARGKGNYRIRNLVHEKGRAYARLTAWAEKGKSEVTGLWSPDSRVAYPYLGA